MAISRGGRVPAGWPARGSGSPGLRGSGASPFGLLCEWSWEKDREGVGRTLCSGCCWLERTEAAGWRSLSFWICFLFCFVLFLLLLLSPFFICFCFVYLLLLFVCFFFCKVWSLLCSVFARAQLCLAWFDAFIFFSFAPSSVQFFFFLLQMLLQILLFFFFLVCLVVVGCWLEGEGKRGSGGERVGAERKKEKRGRGGRAASRLSGLLSQK